MGHKTNRRDWRKTFWYGVPLVGAAVFLWVAGLAIAQGELVLTMLALYCAATESARPRFAKAHFDRGWTHGFSDAVRLHHELTAHDAGQGASLNLRILASGDPFPDPWLPAVPPPMLVEPHDD